MQSADTCPRIAGQNACMLHDAQALGPYVQRSRDDWAELAHSTPMTLDAATLEKVRGLSDPTSLVDVAEVYLPLTGLLSKYVLHTGALHRSTNEFLGLSVDRTPFVIGIAGSVAVGKSTTARLLRELLAGWPEHPRVELITTDGFLLPNAELERRGLLHRKGFPESYDRRALLRFVMDVKSGKDEVSAPVYSHLIYDIVPEERVVVKRPDILIMEGLNVLQPARVRPNGTTGLAVSDFFDFSVYVDADTDDIRSWYVSRFLSLRDTAFRDPRSYFARYADLNEAQAIRQAQHLWDTINGPNLDRNIRTTRERATAILRKASDHRVEWVRIRKV
ncbi:MAG: Pantothenate kinase [uncultured Propionibacteriaceae bacterium]|uniref:Pantothenate kinase n=1 Tax=uncultured Propionibacteriaceae bacterium TaxID=257457 RepID=A0A6J4PGW8_9ACTN|nr:MAG: Pantothenate kinase [uncultured Propionibacteriaceae bacterium]